MLDESQWELLAEIASMYYEESLTQSEIADRLGISRVKVYRLLKEARDENVVQIVIRRPIHRDATLEKSLQHCFGLKAALVLKAEGVEREQVLQRVGQLGARYLEQILQDGSTLAVCLGRATYEVVSAISPGFKARVRVAQAVGSMPFTMQKLDSSTLARQLAQRLGGEVLYLASPMMADSTEAAEVIRSQRGIASTLQAARAADVALLGIGNLDPATSRFGESGIIPAQELIRLREMGAVGDIAGQIFTLEGALHANQYNQRVIGITLEELAHIPTTIAVAIGREKAHAMVGALRTGVVDVLCTDDESARSVLEVAGCQCAQQELDVV